MLVRGSENLKNCARVGEEDSNENKSESEEENSGFSNVHQNLTDDSFLNNESQEVDVTAEPSLSTTNNQIFIWN